MTDEILEKIKSKILDTIEGEDTQREHKKPGVERAMRYMFCGGLYRALRIIEEVENEHKEKD